MNSKNSLTMPLWTYFQTSTTRYYRPYILLTCDGGPWIAITCNTEVNSKNSNLDLKSQKLKIYIKQLNSRYSSQTATDHFAKF